VRLWCQGTNDEPYVNDCPIRSFPGGLLALNNASPAAVEYLLNLNLDVLSYFIIIHWSYE
jgi:hypothetical protein